MTYVISIENQENELMWFLRNQDILTTTQRGVTNSSETGTFAATTTYLLAVSNVKNIRSIEVASVTLTYGVDYTYNTDYNDSGTIKTRIVFTVAQTGAYEIDYDFGTHDAIYSDFPRDDLSLSAYPRIGFEIISSDTQDFALGGGNDITDALISIVVYANKKTTINSLIDTIRAKIIANKKNFYYFPYIRPMRTGPLIANEPPAKTEIMHRNIDIIARFIVETV